MATTFPALLALLVIMGVPPNGIGPIESPGCDDGDPDTPCCPLESGEYLSGIDDWWSCLFTEPPPPRLL